jgi:protein-tyrosine phosphatase
MAHVLIVCTANICRSPLVEAMLRQKLQINGYKDWVVSSAGTWAEWERPAARYSQKIAQRIGLDLADHVAKMITPDMMATADLVLVMTGNHKEALQIDFKDQSDKVFLMSEMVGRSYNIVDPYGGPPEGYEEMYRDVSRLLDQGFDNIVALASGDAVVASQE